MNWKNGLRERGVLAALGAALLFGAGTPLAKWLLDAATGPWLLAGLLYLGSGLGLALYRRLIRAPAVRLPRREAYWFAGAILAGGIVAPVLLMVGLSRMPASEASLLNAESLFGALLAWWVFKENFDRRIALGLVAIVAGTAVLSWPSEVRLTSLWPALATLGACFAWGIDNNLTRKISLTDATWIASVKGLVAGAANLTLAFALGASLPDFLHLAGEWRSVCSPMGSVLFYSWLACVTLARRERERTSRWHRSSGHCSPWSLTHDHPHFFRCSPPAYSLTVE